MPKSPDAHAGPGEVTVEMKAVTPEDVKKRQAEMQRELVRQRGDEIVEDAAKFVKNTADAARARIGTGVTSLMGRLGTALSGAWSGLGRAAGKAWDGALLGVGYGAVAVDKTVEAAGAVRTAAVDAAVGTRDAVVRGAEVTRDAAVAGYDHMTDLNKSETVQAYRGAKRMAGEGAEYIAGKAGEASEYVTTQFNALWDRVLATGRAIIESKAGKYTAKALKYAGIGTGVAIGVPLAVGGYAVAAPMLAWKNPEGLKMVRDAVKESFPTMGMNVGEAIEKVGARISERGRQSATSAWDRMTNAWDGLRDWANTKRVGMMESAGIASTADVKKAMDEAAELRAQLAELRAQMSAGSSGAQSGDAASG